MHETTSFTQAFFVKWIRKKTKEYKIINEKYNYDFYTLKQKHDKTV